MHERRLDVADGVQPARDGRHLVGGVDAEGGGADAEEELQLPLGDAVVLDRGVEADERQQLLLEVQECVESEPVEDLRLLRQGLLQERHAEVDVEVDLAEDVSDVSLYD